MSENLRLIGFALKWFVAVASVARADDLYSVLTANSQRGFASWKCSVYAQKSGGREDFARALASQGMELFSKVLSDDLIEEYLESDEHVRPLGVLKGFQGQTSIDFQMGFLMAVTIDLALSVLEDQIPNKEEDNAVLLKAYSERQFRRENCDLILVKSE